MPKLVSSVVTILVSDKNFPKFKPLKLNKLNFDELNAAENKLNIYSDQSVQLINKTYIPRKSY